jgi:hypothetical protein
VLSISKKYVDSYVCHPYLILQYCSTAVCMCCIFVRLVTAVGTCVALHLYASKLAIAAPALKTDKTLLLRSDEKPPSTKKRLDEKSAANPLIIHSLVAKNYPLNAFVSQVLIH